MKKQIVFLLVLFISGYGFGQKKQFTELSPSSPTGAGVMVMQNSDNINAPNSKFTISQLWAGTPLAGDVTGTAGATVVEKIQGRPVSSSLPTTGQAIVWNGSTWGPATVSGGGGMADPGGNGIIKRTSLNTTAVAVAGTDFEAPITVLPVSKGGTGTATPSLVAGTNITITGTFPNQTINASGGSSITLTTTGTSGAATLIGNTLNIPQYSGGGGGTWGSITGTLSSQTDLNTALNNRELIANKATNLTSPDNTKYPTTLAVSNAIAGLGNNGGQRTFQTATVTANAVTLDCANKAMSNFQISNNTNITFTINNLADGDELFVKLTTTANTTLTFTGAESIFYNTPIAGTSASLTGASSTSVYHLAIKKIGSNLSIIIQQVKA